MRPERLQLSRRKGYQLPMGAVVVSRPSKWGNPFQVGVDGTREECVKLYQALLRGYICLTKSPTVQQQEAVRDHVAAHIGELKGKALACWCPLSGDYWSCHANVLLDLANGEAQS